MNCSLGRQHQRSNRSGVLQSRTSNLGRVYHTGLEQVLILLRLGVESAVRIFRLTDLADDNCPFTARVLSDPANRLFKYAMNDVDARLFIRLVRL